MSEPGSERRSSQRRRSDTHTGLDLALREGDGHILRNRSTARAVGDRGEEYGGVLDEVAGQLSGTVRATTRQFSFEAAGQALIPVGVVASATPRRSTMWRVCPVCVLWSCWDWLSRSEEGRRSGRRSPREIRSDNR